MKVLFDLSTQYGMAGNQFAMADILHCGNKTYQINFYPIDIETDNDTMELLKRDVHNKECECGCNS
jgi:hypothetical protein